MICFGKLMSISDELMWRYFELLSFRPWRKSSYGYGNASKAQIPGNYKVKLAQEIIERFHDAAAASKALENFEARFQRGAIPDEMDELELKIGGHWLLYCKFIKGCRINEQYVRSD